MSPYRNNAPPDNFFVHQGARVRVVCSFRERLAHWLHGGFRPAAWHGKSGTVIREVTYYGCPCGGETCCVGDKRIVSRGVLIDFLFAGTRDDVDAAGVVIPLKNLEPA